VNGIGEASHADFGITGARNEGLIFSRGQALRKVPQEQLVDALFAEIDKYTTSKRIDVDARAAAEGAVWLQANEDETAMTPERLAAIGKAESAAHDGGDEVLLAIDEEISPVAGRRFSRA
jgi:(E)-4-hydroxy-3-methylbut-2-enyl-diphosphate synthase